MIPHVVALAGWLVLAWRWLRRNPACRVEFVIACMLVVLIAAGFVWGVPPSSIPYRWITPLQEGQSARNILELYAQSTHAGSGWGAVLELVRAGQQATIRDVVRMNLSLAAINAVLLAVVLRQVVTRWFVAGALVLCWAASANGLSAMLSELPSELLTTYFLLALLPAAVFEGEESPRRGPWALFAVANVACWAALAATIRVESLSIGGVAVLSMLLRAACGDAVLHNRSANVLRWVDSHIWYFVAAVCVAYAGTEALAKLARFTRDPRVAWVLKSPQYWWPMNCSLPWVWADFAPIPLVVAAVVGVASAVRRPLRTAMLPITLVALWAVYHAASHGAPYERFRYISMLTAPLVVLAAMGIRDVEAFVRARPGWRSRCVWGLAALVGISAIPGVPGQSAFALRADVAGERERSILLARNEQNEVRYLIEATEAHPRCVFVARVSSAAERRDLPPLDSWIFFGAPLRSPLIASARGRTLLEVTHQTVPDGPCVLYYRSFDCSFLRAHGECDADVGDARAIERRSFQSRPYADSVEYGELGSVVETGLFSMRSQPADLRHDRGY